MFVTTFETSIEIDNKGNIYSDFSEKEAKDHLRFFVQLIEEDNIRYSKMNEGMVNFSNKDIVISFRVEVDINDCSTLKNMLSSMSFEEAKNFIRENVID